MRTKDKVLALLETRRGQSISGEAIAQELSISRAAVWKAIQTLRDEGHHISAAPKKGYALSEDSDILSEQGMRPFLTQDVGVHIYSSVGSTNETAKELAMAGAAHGTVVTAESQSAGRGRYGRSFYSPAGQGIYMSLILRPEHLWLNTPTLITSFAAVAVCEAVEVLCHKQPKIKWVNDIFLEQKKICGILTEAVTDFESGQIGWIVVGIGINFTGEFPPELRDIATSLFVHELPAVTRNQLIAEIVNRMLAMKDEQALLAQYKSRLNMLNKQVLVRGSEEYTATALDIDDTARLIVRRATGETQALSSGEVSIVNLNKNNG